MRQIIPASFGQFEISNKRRPSTTSRTSPSSSLRADSCWQMSDPRSAPSPSPSAFPLLQPVLLVFALVLRLLSTLLRNMSLASDSPRGSLPPLPNEVADKRTFKAEIRKRDSEFQQLQQRNFDLQLKLSHFQNRLLDQEEPRRESAEPEPDDFYNFVDDDDEDNANRAKVIDANFNDDNPLVQTLRKELSGIRAENERLVDKNHQLTDALDDLREKSVADAEDAEAKRTALHAEMQTLANQVEDLQSEALKCELQASQMRETVQAAQDQVESAHEEIKRGEQKEIAMRTKAEGLRMQYDVTSRALQQETRAKDDALRRMAEKSLEIEAVKKELERKTSFAEEAKAQNEEAAAALQKMQMEVVSMREERDAALVRCEKEKEKGKIWTETEKQLLEGDLLLSGDGNALEQLAKLLRGQQSAYNNISEYEPRWRERVLADMNECLRALYRSQREVEAKRQYFVDSYCAVSDSTSSVNQPRAPATAHVS